MKLQRSWAISGIERNLPLAAFGLVTLIVGVVTGYFMYTHPEGLNPDWPLGMALIAPAVFVFGGLHMIAAGLGQPRLSILMLRAILLCFWAILNWAGFFSTHVQCRATVSFLGVAVFGWQPSETECLESLRALVASIDTAILIVVAAFLWQRYRASRKKEPTPPTRSTFKA
ncbi:MAG TPA: hypothetical protein VJ725_19810 [Thermoanaerobaculia bacterium]|nr:hypothetical protein [Thermoanaerobaculia bacterium]